MALTQDKERKRRVQFKSTRKWKRRKLENKFNQTSQLAQKELHKVTYKSGVAHSRISEEAVIPAARMPPAVHKVHYECQFQELFCDTETTSLSKDCHITHIAAVSENDLFNQYNLLTRTITASASEVTSLKVTDNVMYYKGQPVQSVNLKEALTFYLLWLQNVGQCLIIGHKFFRFDLPRLLRSFEKLQFTESLFKKVLLVARTLTSFTKVCIQTFLFIIKNIW